MKVLYVNKYASEYNTMRGMVTPMLYSSPRSANPTRASLGDIYVSAVKVLCRDRVARELQVYTCFNRWRL